MNKKTHKVMTYIKWNFAAFAFLAILYFAVGELLLPGDVQKQGHTYKELTGAWYVVKADGTRVPFSVPGKYDVPRGESVTVETVLPDDLEDNLYLCIRNAKQDMQIRVDGVLREDYISGVGRLFGKNGAVIYLFEEVFAEDGGKTLSITTRTDSSYSGTFYTVHYGDMFGIWQYFFGLYGSELVVALLTFVLGVISAIGSMALRRFYHKEIELQYLSVGVSIAALWVVTNSTFRQLIFPNLAVVNDIAFCMVMLLPFPFLIYVNAIQKRRYEVCYCSIGVIATVSFLLCVFLHMLRIRDFTDTFPLIAANCGLVILAMFVTMFLDIMHGYIRQYLLVAVGIWGVCLAAVCQIFSYFRRESAFNGVTMAFGLVFLLAISVVNTIREILTMENDKLQAESASEAKARFLARMSHEIRTPINAVLGMDEMILRESREPVIRDYALDIQNAGRTLLSLVNDILDFSKIESGKMELVCVEYDFSSMVHDIFNMISMRAEAKELELKLSVEESLPSRLYGDDVRIRQILVNLMNNAVKYTNSGTVCLTVSGKIVDENVQLHFSVADTGIGIRPEDIDKLFVEFERIEEERNRKVEGTGLGMSITVLLLKMMGSNLKVQSEYGKGSTFSFELIQKIVDMEPVGNLEERILKQREDFSYQAAFVAAEASVLVVDDNSVNRRVFKSLLKETHVQVDEADCGKRCLELVHRKKYDVIFLDHMMPDMDGIAVIHAMRECGQDYPCKNTPVVALTANAIVGAKEMYLAEGFDDFLSKPIIPEKLEGMLLRLLPEELVGLPENSAEQRTAERVPEIPASREELPEIAGVDWEYALLHMKDLDILCDTVVDFVRMSDAEAKKLQSLWEALPQCDDIEDEIYHEKFAQYRILIHAMKSNARMIGAVSLGGMAALLEKYATEESRGQIDRMMPAFMEEWRALGQGLSFFINASESAGREAAADEEIAEAFELLEEALEEMDIDEADRIMAYLKRLKYPASRQMYIENMQLAVVRMDVDLFRTLVKQFKEERD